MKIQLKPRGEEGTALLITITTALVLGIVIGSCLNMVATQNQSVARSQAWNTAIPAAEAGIEEAFSHYYRNTANLATEGWVLANGYYSKSRNLDARSSFAVGIKNVYPPLMIATGFVTVPMSTTSKVARVVAIETMRFSPYSKAVVSMTYVDLNGKNVTADSFDSTNSLYNTGGQYDKTKRKDNGDIASVLGVVDILSIGNAKVYGSLHTGPGGTASIGPNGSVGTTNYVDGGSKGIQTDHFADDINLSFPDVQVPFTSGYFTPGPGTISSNSYNYVLTNSAPSTNYQLSSFDGTLYVAQSSVLYITGDATIKGIVIAPGAIVKIYQGTKSGSAVGLKVAGNNTANSAGYAYQLRYYGLPSVQSIDLDGNARYTGTIYAPQAAISMNGSGNNVYDVTGAAVVKSVKMNGNFNFHYDEALSAWDEGFLAIKSWWEM